MIVGDWAISQVQKDADGDIQHVRAHQVFAGMLGDAPLAISRQNIIKMIQDEGKSVVTVREHQGQWVQGEDVHVTSKNYIRTDPNETESDNLGDLPEFKREAK